MSALWDVHCLAPLHSACTDSRHHDCLVAGISTRLTTLKRIMLNAGQGDSKAPGAVARADFAAVCVAAITATAADKITFELGADKSQGAAQGPIADTFSSLKQGVYQ